METCDPVGTPMEIKDKLDLDKNVTIVDATKYRNMIGPLMYLTSSKPNIIHVTCYVLGTRLSHREAPQGDADYAGCKDTFKSTSGGTQFLGEKLVGWSSKKQDSTSNSSTVGIMVRKEAPMGFLSEDRNDLRPADLLLFNWLQGKDACLDVTCISRFAGMGASSWAPVVALHNVGIRHRGFGHTFPY
ncbi:hypothetical protein Tco_0318028 [Tanacetum coccineum]